MNYDYKQTLLSRSMMSGLLAGLVAVIANFIFNFIYREVSGFALSEVVNVTSIIFLSLIVATVGGVLYFMLRKSGTSRAIYVILFILLTIAGVYGDIETQRTQFPVQNHEFRILFGGVIAITGLCTAFLVPYFNKHDKIYN